MIKKIVLFFVCIISVSMLHAQQTKEDIQKKQQQLQSEIKQLNNTLSEIKLSKKQSLGQVALVQRKIAARQELIGNINTDIKRIDNNIYKQSIEISRLKKELDSLKVNYSKSLVFAYKNRSNYDYLNFLFSATNFNDAIKRLSYLKSYKQYRETQVSTIVQTQTLLKTKLGTLTTDKTEKGSALKDQNTQLVVLEDDKKEKDQVVKGLLGKEKDIAVQIKTNQKNQQKLQASLQVIINREIAEAKKKADADAKKKEADRIAKVKADAADAKQKADADAKQKADAAKLQTTNNTKTATDAKTIANPNTTAAKTDVKTNDVNKVVTDVAVAPKKTERVYTPLESDPANMNLSLNFESNRTRLPWPVDKGYIAIHFGRYEYSDKLTGVSTGIYIATPTGTAVKSVANGEVSAVFDLGGQQAIVIKHGKYFTVYSNITSIKVSRGSQVNAGAVLGNAGVADDGEGQILFMVTDGNNNLDPERWLRPR